MNVSRRAFAQFNTESALRVSFRRAVWIGLLLIASLPWNANADTTDAFLEANGLNIRNGHGTGDIVPLHGANLGGWLLMESWMCPMDSSGIPDHYTAVQTLVGRFGTNTEESLIRTYQNTWVMTNDLDNIRALGMNLVRVPIMWTDLQRLDGTWRADAFDRLDWVVSNAWQRGLYTILDLHGVPGGVSSSQSAGVENSNAYWTNSADQAQTTVIWSNIAAHFVGNPAVAGYDLMNEPYGAPTQTAIWTAYNGLYQIVRAIDSNHIILMEGTWTGTSTNGEQLNWQWDVLPAPTVYNWSNVVYQMHAYAGSSGAVQSEVDKQTSDFLSHQSWNVPAYIGEFQGYGSGSAWEYAVTQFNTNGMSWSTWAYKAINGTVGDTWGIYDPTNSSIPPRPNLQTDSSATISNDWSQGPTATAFGITSYLKQYLGGPLAVADSYTNYVNSTLTIGSSLGVLANDLDINIGIAGIQLSAIWVDGPSNGQLTFNADGSFSYTGNQGFTGVDTFRYRAFDGYADSVNIAIVSILVNTSAGLPTNWSDADVGAPSLAGSAQYNFGSGAWTVSGSGTNIGGAADQFNYASESYAGDGTIIAEVNSLQNTDPAAAAGVMFRADGTTNSSFAAVMVTAGDGLTFLWRDAVSNLNGAASIPGIAAPVWLKLTRSGGNSFAGYYSSDGTNWTQIGSAQLVNGLSSVALAGLAVTSHNASQLAAATFTNVSITPLTAWQQWQVRYFGNIDNPLGESNVDADGDGQSNQQEYLAGTDPTNAMSYFHITSLTTQGSNLSIAWICGSGRTNALQAATSVSGLYSNVSPNIVLVGSGVVTTNYLFTGTQTIVSGGAADNASDPAYTGGNFNGADGGTGFGPWMVSPATNTGNALWFVTTSTTNGANPSGGIDSAGGKSWGSFAGHGATATAVRAFSAGALAVGQTLALDMDNGYVESGGSVGFDLQNSSGQTLLEINYIGMNPGNVYGSIDGTGAHSLGVPYTEAGVHAQITMTSTNAYSASLTPAGGTTVNFSGILTNGSGGQGITQIRLFDNNAAARNNGSHWDVFWNNFSVGGVTNLFGGGALTAPAAYYRVLLVP